jgi:Lipocalin-like domain
MVRKFACCAALELTLCLGLALSIPTRSLAGPEELWGTYKLISTTAKILETREEQSYGNETGYIHRDQQRIDLFKTTTAYAGPYKFDGKTVEHHIDVSWNQLWVGTVLKREVKRDGKRVMLTTPPSPRSKDGKMSVRTLTFEKVE